MPSSERDSEHVIRGEDGYWYSDSEMQTRYEAVPVERRGDTGFFSWTTNDEGDAAAYNAEQAKAYHELQVKNLEDRLPDLSWQDLTPEDMTAAQETEQYALGPSQAEGVYADPQAIEAERRALEQLQQMASQGGYTAADRARIREGQRSAGAYAASQRGAIENQARARGMGGSGMELAALLGASQGGANMNAASTDAATRAGEARAFDALAMSGDLGSQMRGESMREGSYRADSADARDIYDNDQLRRMQAQNTANEQAARGMNTQTRNNFMQGNAEASRRYGQANWENRWRLANARLPAADRIEATNNAAFNSDTNAWGGVLGAAGTIGGAIIGGPAGAAAGGTAGKALGDELDD